jgi:hypothetical protein
MSALSPTTDLPAAVARLLGRVVLRYVVVVAGLTLGGHLAGLAPQTIDIVGEGRTAAPRSAVVDTLVRDHHCWVGQAPPGTGVPSRAVVTLPGDDPRLAPSRVGFGIWLQGRPGTLHAFCP